VGTPLHQPTGDFFNGIRHKRTCGLEPLNAPINQAKPRPIKWAQISGNKESRMPLWDCGRGSAAGAVSDGSIGERVEGAFCAFDLRRLGIVVSDSELFDLVPSDSAAAFGSAASDFTAPGSEAAGATTAGFDGAKRGNRAIPIRPGVFWRLRRSMMASPARTRPGPVAPECRSCATGLLRFNAEAAGH
jgi:hypothetical protein